MSLTPIHVYHEDAHAIGDAIRARAPGRAIVPIVDEHTLRALAPAIEILFAGALPASALDRAGRVRLVQAMSAGVDELLPGAPPVGAIANARGVLAQGVAEHALALLLALARGVPTIVERQRRKEWRPFPNGTLAGRTLVVVGLGEIGGRVARFGASIGMRVVGVSQRARPLPSCERVLGPSHLHEALSEADALVLALPRVVGAHGTRGILDAVAIATLPKGALVVNVGRGDAIDEPALLAALADGRVGGAALDVFADEPLPPESPWWTAPNVIVSPHLAGLHKGHMGLLIGRLLDNVDRLERGAPLVDVVDRALGY